MQVWKVVFYEYGFFKREFDKLMQPLVACKYRPAKMDFAQRIRTLSRIESAYRGLYFFADRILAESAKVPRGNGYNRDAERYLRKKLPQYNIIEISAGPFGDYIVKAPPLGDRPSGTSAFIAYYTQRALETAKQQGVTFQPLKDGCIIVKQYCHCEEVAMGTLENREVHALTDTIVKAAGMDDAPVYFDCCYVWCESDNPRTEIVITPRDCVSYYEDFVNNLYEQPIEEVKRQYRVTKTNRDRLLRAVANINEQLAKYITIEVEDGMIGQKLALDLIHLARDLAHIIKALRCPFINDAAHANSRAYSKAIGQKRRNQKKSLEQEHEEEIAFLQRLSNMVRVRDVISVLTYSPLNFRQESGRELCEEQEIMLRRGINSVEGQRLFTQCNDLVAEIIRYVGTSGFLDVDADNINTGFLQPFAHRVKIIYSKSSSLAPPSTHDCIINLWPKSYKISL